MHHCSVTAAASRDGAGGTIVSDQRGRTGSSSGRGVVFLTRLARESIRASAQVLKPKTARNRHEETDRFESGKHFAPSPVKGRTRRRVPARTACNRGATRSHPAPRSAHVRAGSSRPAKPSRTPVGRARSGGAEPEESRARRIARGGASCMRVNRPCGPGSGGRRGLVRRRPW